MGLQSVVRNVYTLLCNIHRKKGAPAVDPERVWPLEPKKKIDVGAIMRKWNGV